jgi:hypothetical protein
MSDEISDLQGDIMRLEKAVIWLVSVLEDSKTINSNEAETLGKILIGDEEES